MTTEQFDFLKDVVANIPDPVETVDGEASSSAAATGVISGNMESVLSGDEAEPLAPVQVKKRRGRKRNADDEEHEGTISTSTVTNPPKTRRSTRKRKEVNETEV